MELLLSNLSNPAELALLEACAVGEKNSPCCGADDCLLSWSSLNGFMGFPALVSASRDMLLPFSYSLLYACFPVPYMAPLFQVGPLFSGPRSEARAARLTDRLMLHATRPRQSSTQAPMKAKTAPTAMNTVPSGMVDFCMNGAAAV